jgi:O-antigen/teichoic acid export membrane protein
MIAEGSRVLFDPVSESTSPISISTVSTVSTVAQAEAGTVQARALSGVLSLLGREVVIRVMSVGGAVVLSRFLSPVEYGLFGIATFVVGIVALFSELGLGAAFIRRKEEVTDKELNAMFTLQLAFVSALAGGLFLLAPAVAGLYDVPAVEWLIRALAVNVIVASLRSVPVVVAERNLNYRPIALADVVGQFSYWLVAISGAVLGLGVWSLVLAVSVSGLAGSAALYIRTAWRPTLDFNWRPLKESVRYGLLYQSQSVASFVKDTMVPAIGGPVFGPLAVGYLAWAVQLTAMPLILGQLVSRVCYPALGRLQNDRKAFIAMLEAALAWTYRLSLPVFAVLVGLAPRIIEHIFTSKWLPAEPSIYLLTINMVLGIGTGIFVAALYSLGRGGSVLRVTGAWAGLTWVSAILMITLGLGFEAIAAAYAVGTAIAFPVMIYELRDLGGILLLRSAALPFVTCLIGGALLYMSRSWVTDLWRLLLIAGLGTLVMWAISLWPNRHAVFAIAGRLLPEIAGSGSSANSSAGRES